jgi:Extensin-like protein C-terminus
MVRDVRWYVLAGVGLAVLAGCGRGFVQYVQREPWREKAEVACLQSGTVREGAGLVRIAPIEGPGICGATHPLKVAAFGVGSSYGYAEEAVRPPGSIPMGSQPRWPIATQPVTRSVAPPLDQPRYVPSAEPRMLAPPPGAQQYPQHQPPQTAVAPPPAQVGAPMSISPPGIDPYASTPPQYPHPQRREIDAQGLPPLSAAPLSGPPLASPPSNNEDNYPRVQTQPAAPSPSFGRPLPALGPQRGPRATGSATPVEVKPAATLACPIVSALDHWIASAVQPAAQKWFGQPVVEIRQISAYSCRGMNGQVGARISEHAFGNALDIAAFVLADGTRITVKRGWQGSAEEQAFLRDVQGAACDQFTTVLAPGSNRFHYDHIHVDLMRRASGRRICQPGAVDGELIAARVRRDPSMMAQRPFEPPPTRRYDPPFDERNDPFAWRGDSARRSDPATTGSIGFQRNKSASPDEDNDWTEHDGPRHGID